MSAGLVAARSKLAVYQGVPRHWVQCYYYCLAINACTHIHTIAHCTPIMIPFQCLWPMSWAHRDDQWRPTSMLHVDTVQVKKWQICKNSIINKSSRAMYYTPYINCHFSEQHFYHSQKTFDAKNLLAILTQKFSICLCHCAIQFQQNIPCHCAIVLYSLSRTYHAIVPLCYTV